MIDSFNNINELTNEDSRIVRANFSLKLQGYIVPDNVQKKLKEQNTRYFSKAQIILNQATTVIDEPGQKLKSVRTTGGSGGSFTKNITNNTNVGQDDDWTTTTPGLLINGDSRNVQIDNAYLTVDIGNTKNDDIFIVKKSGDEQLKVNNEGVLSLKNFTSFPSVVEGGLLIKNNDFYIGI